MLTTRNKRKEKSRNGGKLHMKGMKGLNPRTKNAIQCTQKLTNDQLDCIGKLQASPVAYL